MSDQPATPPDLTPEELEEAKQYASVEEYLHRRAHFVDDHPESAFDFIDSDGDPE